MKLRKRSTKPDQAVNLGKSGSKDKDCLTEKKVCSVGVDTKSMELKKNDQTKSEPSKVSSETAAKKFKLRDFIEEIKLELRNINWTSKEELKVYTQIVVMATFVFGMGVYVVDLLIQSALNLLTGLTRLIAG